MRWCLRRAGGRHKQSRRKGCRFRVAVRRFTFKLQFDYLEAEGKRAFFERMFHTRLTEEESMRLAAIPSLAPGDFRTVRQSLYYLGGTVTNDTRLSELEKESSLKKGTSRRVGF